MTALVPARRHDEEWIDRKDNDPVDLAHALGDIRSVNRHLGGERVLLEALDPWLDRGPEGGVFDVLDVGTGMGDLPLAMVRRGRSRRRAVRVTAVDNDPETVATAKRFTAHEPGVTVLHADAAALPFPEASFDAVTCSMFLHHFSHEEIVGLLRSFRGIARRVVLVNDLRRHLFPWAFIALASRLTRRHPMFVHDAPLSVLRGFTRAELEAAARDAGASGAKVLSRWPFRLVLVLPVP